MALKVTDRAKWERTKDRFTIAVWTGLLFLFMYRAANDIDTNLDLLSMVVAVSGWRLSKMIVESDKD
jgi:hypothetical protein